jgi:SHS2 domain-containing protein
MSFRYFSHTGDIAARIRACDRADLYQTGVDLVRDVVVGGSPVRAEIEHRIPRSSAAAAADLPSEADGYFDFLRELLFLYDVERFVPRQVELEEGGTPAEVAVVRGETFDPERHECERELKAVTRHGYSFRWQAEEAAVEGPRDSREPEPIDEPGYPEPGYTVEVVFDI